jgi:hypothetical protein
LTLEEFSTFWVAKQAFVPRANRPEFEWPQLSC